MVLTRRLYNYETTQFEQVNSELKRSFHEQNKSNGISINTENVFWTKTIYFMFSKGESVLRNCVMDCGFYLSKSGGLFRKITREGVSDVPGRWIMDGWLRTDGRERERGAGREQ